ncbi:hypothetical protein [Phenylobacterium sp.]|uniref:hypothetical protein n=1 Tax=Phenylobacterium sp. TaxID=1871053 RepID=UPI002F3EDAFB
MGTGGAMALAILGTADAARAQDGIFGRDTIHGLAEVRLAGAEGERSWIDGGFGKAAVPGGGEGGWRDSAGLSQAVVEWRPSFSFAVSAVISAQWQADTDPKLDLDEAYLKLKAPPSQLGGFSVRLGYFYPPVSLENGGVGWTTTDLLSASALNSWIGEEVKVGGLEATYQRRFGDSEVVASAAVFGWNDTSGTLISFRGWALHGVRTGVRTEFGLPPLTPFITPRQDDGTYPFREIDGRPGFYGRLEWRPPAPVTVQVFHYDNRGDRVSEQDLQWAWQTRFSELSVLWTPDPETKIRAQALSGRTWMGYPRPETWVDVGFSSAYLMATHDLGPGAASLRIDGFQTKDNTQAKLAAADEGGWALTAGWRQPITAWVDLFVEAQQIESRRPGRLLAGDAPTRAETVLQSAVRLHF